MWMRIPRRQEYRQSDQGHRVRQRRHVDLQPGARLTGERAMGTLLTRDVCCVHIDPSTGQPRPRTRWTTRQGEYSVTVTATDQERGDRHYRDNYHGEDVDEPPSEPSKPTVTVDRTSPTKILNVSWTAPDNEGKPLSIGTRSGIAPAVRGIPCPMSTANTTMARISSLSPDTNYR